VNGVREPALALASPIQLHNTHMTEKPVFEEILPSYRKLAFSIAANYRKCGIPMEDLQQESLLGLFKACQNYSPSKETKFSTYAVYWIKKQVLEAIRRELGQSFSTSELSEEHASSLSVKDEAETDISPLRLPKDMPELEQNIIRLSFTESLSLKEIAQKLGISVEKTKQHKQKALRRLKSKLPADR